MFLGFRLLETCIQRLASLVLALVDASGLFHTDESSQLGKLASQDLVIVFVGWPLARVEVLDETLNGREVEVGQRDFVADGADAMKSRRCR